MNVQTNSTTAQTNTSPHSCLITSAYPSLSVGADKVVPAVDGVAHLKYDYPGKNKTITSLQSTSSITLTLVIYLTNTTKDDITISIKISLYRYFVISF